MPSRPQSHSSNRLNHLHKRLNFSSLKARGLEFAQGLAIIVTNRPHPHRVLPPDQTPPHPPPPPRPGPAAPGRQTRRRLRPRRRRLRPRLRPGLAWRRGLVPTKASEGVLEFSLFKTNKKEANASFFWFPVLKTTKKKANASFFGFSRIKNHQEEGKGFSFCWGVPSKF